MNFGPSPSDSNHDIENSFQRLSVTQISPNDVGKNFMTLQKTFTRVNPTKSACLRPQHDTGSFSHFEQGVRLCEIYTDIGKTFVDRSKIALARECLIRLQTSAEFVRELEEAVENYTSYVESERKIPRDFPFRVERFHDFCQNAKTHFMYRVSLTKIISTDAWLRNSVPDMEDDLTMVYRKLYQHAETALSLIGNILLCVLRIAEKCKWGLNRQELNAVCQGIEDFNRLVECCKEFESDEQKLLSLNEARRCALSKTKASLAVFLVPAVSISSDIYLLSLNKLLNGIAAVRSKILAGHVHKFLSEHQEVSRTLKYDFASSFEWKDFGVVCSGGNVRLEGAPKNGVLSVLSRNQIPLLKLDSESPLLLFDSEEKKFFCNLLSQLATSTTLILGRHIRGEKKSGVLPPLQSPTYDVTDPKARGNEEGGVSPTLTSHPEGHGILRHSPGHGSPRLNKRVQWNAPLDLESTNQIHSQYSAMLWSSFGEELINAMTENPGFVSATDGSLGPLFLWSHLLQMVIVRMLESLRLSDCLPPAGASSLQAVSCYLHCLASASSWDSAFCNLIGTAVTDRCRMNGNLTDGIPGTQTVCSMIKLLDPLDSIFEMTSYWKRTPNQPEPFSSRGPRVTTLMLSPSLCRLHALMSFSLNWLDTKMQQFLASWSLAQFLLLMQWDLPIILESVKKTFSLIQLLCVVHDDSTNWNSLSLHYNHLQEQRNKLEGLVKKLWALFSKDMTKMSTEFFQEAMPVGKSWKKSRHSGVPYQRNSYVEHAVCQILEPVVESTEGLPLEGRINVLTLTVNTMMEAWSEWILKQEIVFSFYGAQQLSLDFGYIKVWLASDSSNLSSEIQSHLLNLDVFRHLDGAVRLLMLQPRKKKQSPGDSEDPELESNVSTVSSSSVLSSLSGVDIDGYDIDVLNDKTIPNRQKWLDLRLRGGKSKKGLLPFCLKVQEMK